MFRLSRRIFATCSILTAMALLYGCTRGKHTGSSTGGSAKAATLRYPLTLEPATLDPACINETPTLEMLQNIYDGLVIFDENNRIVPNLAEKWEISPDGKTYTFHLRPDVRFHNGRQLTSADVKYSLERALWKETKSGVAGTYLAGISGCKEAATGARRDLPGVSTPDPLTVVIQLTGPRGYFLGELAYPTGWVVCREAIEKNGGVLDEKATVGTGPYTLASYRHGYGFVLTPNPSYWGEKPKVDRIERPIIRDSQTVHVRYENNELDMCSDSPADFLKDKSNPALRDQIHVMPSGLTTFLVMQPKRQPAFADRRVRRAIAMAINRDDVVKIASQGVWQRADSFLPPGFPGFNANFRKIPYDPDGARKLLAEAGFPDGKGFPNLTLVFEQNTPEYSALAQIVRDNLKQNLGIGVDLQEHEAATLRTDVFAQKVPFSLANWAPDYIDPQNFLSMLLRTGANMNFSSYSNPQFDALCDKADIESDMAKRLPLYQQADQIAMDDVAIFPIYYGTSRILAKPHLRGWSRNLMSFLPHTKTRIEPK
jgi:oligopeptide transport system substrate-binding protein